MKTPARVLFVCIGNSCRSQMAEAFGRAYGHDVMIASSAGLSPAWNISPDTALVMGEKNIVLQGQYPKRFNPTQANDFDLIVNISGFDLPGDLRTPVRTWTVRDPINEEHAVHREVRDQIEFLVMELILELRRKPKK